MRSVPRRSIPKASINAASGSAASSTSHARAICRATAPRRRSERRPRSDSTSSIAVISELTSQSRASGAASRGRSTNWSISDVVQPRKTWSVREPPRRCPQTEVRPMARPSVVAGPLDPDDVERVAVDVADRRDEVGLVDDQPRVEPPSEQRAVASDPIVDVAGVQRAEALHPGGQSAVGAVPQVMEVIVHQAVRVRANVEPIEHVSESLAHLDAVAVVEEHVAVVDSTIHHVVPTVFDVDAWWSGHTPIMNKGCYIAGLTPDVISRGRGRGISTGPARRGSSCRRARRRA